MAQNIKLKRSSVPGKVPTTIQLETGEIAINTADGKLYFERDDASIQTIITTNAVITGSLNINGPITGSDIRINQWGSVSASLATISSQAAVVATLDQVTTQGATTVNNIAVGGLTVDASGSSITGVFRTESGSNTVIIQSNGPGGSNPGLTQIALRDYSTTQKQAIIQYGGTNKDVLKFSNQEGTNLSLSGSIFDQSYIFENGVGLGTGSFLWNNLDPFIRRIATGTTQFLGNATTATTASFALTAPYSGLTGAVPTWNQNTSGNAATATTASYALKAESVGPLNQDVVITGSLAIKGTTTVVQEGIKVSGVSSLAITSISTTTYRGAFFDYVLSSDDQVNRRAGTLTLVWTASDIEWKDGSTMDIGSTEGAEFAPTNSGSNANIILSLPGGDWTVRGHLRYM